jgi:hypothetical protein
MIGVEGDGGGGGGGGGESGSGQSEEDDALMLAVTWEAWDGSEGAEPEGVAVTELGMHYMGVSHPRGWRRTRRADGPQSPALLAAAAPARPVALHLEGARERAELGCARGHRRQRIRRAAPLTRPHPQHDEDYLGCGYGGWPYLRAAYIPDWQLGVYSHRKVRAPATGRPLPTGQTASAPRRRCLCRWLQCHGAPLGSGVLGSPRRPRPAPSTPPPGV